MRPLLGVLLAAVLVLVAASRSAASAADLESAFGAPPPAARPWVFWYWMEGAVSKAGITADLEAMRAAGIGGAYLMPIKDAANPPVYTPAVRTLTPAWWEMLRHAFAEADRLELKFALHACDGFATAGGPWITPELSMQKVTWSRVVVDGGAPGPVVLPSPPANEEFYRDIAVFALPAPPGAGLDTRSVVPKVTTNQPGGDGQFLVGPVGDQQIRTTEPCWIRYEFAEPFTLRSLVVKTWPKNYGGVYHATRLKVSVSDDGTSFRFHTQLMPPRHGWQDWDEDYTFAIPPVTARFFRFDWDPAGSEPGAEDLNGAKWRARLTLRGLELSSEPKVDNFEGKAGAVWRRPTAVTEAHLPPELAVPRERVLDLTAHLRTDGRLDWTPPPGRWLVLRMGHTSTGHRNETAGAGIGLEADKFNPAAVRLQFENWYGESIRQVGPELAGRVLRTFHVDSWEAGSQNWSPVFREEFRRRRGYDPVPWLPVMAGVPLGSAADSERFLADVRRTISDLMDESFFGTLKEFSAAQGVNFSAEATAPTMMGDGMRHFGRVDVPMGEFWLRSPTHDKPNDIHDAISGARVYGRNVVQAEAFTQLRMQWDEHPGMLKPLADEHFALGINRMVFHVFTHNPWTDRRPGMTLGGVGLYFQRDQVWWPVAGAWNDYIARCSALLQQGRPVADVAYFTGEDLPARAILPERRQPALPAGYAADSINRDALLRLARAEDGWLVLPGGARYAALVVPPVASPTAELRDKLQELRAGGVAIIGLRDGSERLAQVLAERTGGPDLVLRGAEDIRWTHRALPQGEIYFLANPREAAVEFSVELRAGGRRPEIWDPQTAEIRGDVAFEVAEGGRVVVPLRLEPHGARFVVLREPAGQPGRLGRNWRQVEPVAEVAGPWEVRFEAAAGGPKEPRRLAQLIDWSAASEPALRHYSGRATYVTEFTAAEPEAGARRWLDLGVVHNLARVRLNGVDCGVAWTAPLQVEVTSALRPGVNRLEIEVYNTWANRLAGDKAAAQADRLTWTTAPAATVSDKLLPAGLLGPVRLMREPLEGRDAR